jgi:uncharacterized membrane protein YebE (DUF533 family)
MRLGPIVGSLLGAFGGRALGGAIGGNTGRMIGSMAGSMLGSGGLGSLGGLFSKFTGGGDKSTAKPLSQSVGVPTGQSADVPDISEEHAMVLIKAMCNAAKSDGTVDETEIDAIMGRLGQLDAEESAHLRSELTGPVDLAGLLASVPQGMEHDVYAVSLLAIDAASGPEAAYLAELAAGLGLPADVVASMKQAVTA